MIFTYSIHASPTPAYRFVKTHPGHPPSLRGRGATDNGDTGSGADGSGALNISRKCTHLRINTYRTRCPSSGCSPAGEAGSARQKTLCM